MNSEKYHITYWYTDFENLCLLKGLLHKLNNSIMLIRVFLFVSNINACLHELHVHLMNFHEFPSATWSPCEQETELPEQEAKKREHDSQPYPSPTHAGGLFAINR